MHVHDEILTPSQKLWITLQRIEETLSMSALHIGPLMSLTPEEYLKCKNKGKEPPIRSLLILCETLNIGFSALMTGNIDFWTVAQHFVGNQDDLPERYSTAAHTKKRVAANLLDYVETTYGWEKRILLMRDLQLTDAALSNFDELVNLRLSIDIVDWISKHYKSNRTLERLGQDILFAPQNATLAIELRPLKSVYELCERFFGGLLEKHLEQNFFWNIQKMSPGRVTIRGCPNDDLAELETSVLKNEAALVVRKGMLSSIPNFIGLGSANTTVTKTLSTDSFIEMEMDLESVLKNKRNNPLYLTRC